MLTTAIVLMLTASSPCTGASTSRWSATPRYRQTIIYGQQENRWLAGAAGIASNQRGDVFIFDLRNSRLHILDEQLNLKTSFGRKGGGPGEFSGFPAAIDRGAILQGNFVAATNTNVYVFDNYRIQVFALDGRFLKILATFRPSGGSSFLFGLRYMHPVNSGLIVAFDSLRREPRVQRTLQTWLYEADQETLLHKLPITPPVLNGRGFTVPIGQAQSLWAAQGDCIVVANGESEWVVRFNLKTGQTDTLRLPKNEVNVEGLRGPPVPDSIRQRRARMGLPPEPGMTAPSAIMKWRQLQIDPDGHLWVQPTRAGPDSETLVAYRIDPAGRVHEERLPIFPHAFGPPGVYYSRSRDPETNEVIVIRYTNRSTR